MIQVTTELLIKCGIRPTQARAFELPLQYACDRYEINTARRLAAFIGQCAIESADFTSLEESLYYTTVGRIREVYKLSVPTDAMALALLRKPQALANQAYANRNGNGNVASGDGWKYRGRGMIHLTGKDNYSLAAFCNQRPYLESPDLVAKPADAALTAAWFFSHNGCNQMADSWETDKITRTVNGPGMQGRLQRRHRCDEILKILKGED